MGGRHSHTQRPPSIEAALASHPKNRASTPDTEELRTARLITAPTVEIIPANVVAPKSVEVIGGNFGFSDTPRSISSSLRAHASSDSGSDAPEDQRSVLRKAYDNIKNAAGNCAENTLASIADVAGGLGNIDPCIIPALSRPSGRYRCRRPSSLVRTARPSSPRAERIENALALLATALGNLILEVYHAWCDNGIMGVIKTWIILIACILDAIWAVVMRVTNRAEPVRRVGFQEVHVSH